MLKGVGLLQVHMILTIFTQGTRLTYDQVFLNLFVLLGFFSGKIVSSVWFQVHSETQKDQENTHF